MLTKKQITEIKQGIKLAVKQIILDGDLWFAETEKETKSIERKIANIKNKEKSYLTQIGYNITLEKVNSVNPQNKDIHNVIYSRNANIIFDTIDVMELIKINNAE